MFATAPTAEPLVTPQAAEMLAQSHARLSAALQRLSAVSRPEEAGPRSPVTGQSAAYSHLLRPGERLVPYANVARDVRRQDLVVVHARPPYWMQPFVCRIIKQHKEHRLYFKFQICTPGIQSSTGRVLPTVETPLYLALGNYIAGKIEGTHEP